MTSRMIKSGRDSTLERNIIKYWQHLISEYELIKVKQHPRFRFVVEFYSFHNIKRQNFIKYYNRFKQTGFNDSTSLLPLKRGPRYSNKRVVTKDIELATIELRRSKGLSRYEIHQELSSKINIAKVPSHSTIYNILKKHNINVGADT